MASVDSVFNHLVLPPKLPDVADDNLGDIELDIVERLREACRVTPDLTGSKWTPVLSSMRQALRFTHEILSGTDLSASLVTAFRQLPPGGSIVLPVQAQNAALLIRRPVGDDESCVIEVFEVSPETTHVLAAQRCLQWEFPGRSVKLSLRTFFDRDFQKQFTAFVRHAASEPLARFVARSIKANVAVAESRDTTDPAIITQMLMCLLEALGSANSSLTISKRVRDDVNIGKAELPWRRLPLWLALRVAIQLFCYHTLGSEEGRVIYKTIMCVMQGKLLQDCVGSIAPEMSTVLIAKLGRRLAKLQSLANAHDLFDLSCTAPMTFLSLHFQTILENANKQLRDAWDRFRATTIRHIPTQWPRPIQATDLQLDLPRSFHILQGIYDTAQRQQSHLHEESNVNEAMASAQPDEFVSRCHELARVEASIANGTHIAFSSGHSRTRVIDLADLITEMLAKFETMNDFDQTQKSIWILACFEVWVSMDQVVANECKLLREYRPVFPAKLLDALQLPKEKDMHRLANIQSYLSARTTHSTSVSISPTSPNGTIFSKVDENCFAVQYTRHSDHLQQLQETIEKTSRAARDAKLEDWHEACAEFEMHSEEIASLPCVCVIDKDGVRDASNCSHCFHRRVRNRMQISCHEEYLPEDDAAKAACVFELQVPNYIAAYRNATWKILIGLCHPSRPINSLKPALILGEYSSLKPYTHRRAEGITLASIEKSWLQTHYRMQQMMADIDDVLLPFGPILHYYDETAKMWIEQLIGNLTLQHLCGVHVPPSLLGSAISPQSHPAIDACGPSSYDAIANRTKCPPDLSMNEFMGLQSLLSSAKNARWLTILAELGSVNLNFSSQDTARVFSQLANQAGPSTKPGAENVLRDSHTFLDDDKFCSRLLERLEGRLAEIEQNWREVHYMDMLISLTLRLCELTKGHTRASAVVLLESIRIVTLEWTDKLRNQIITATDEDMVQTSLRYGLFAALLCRQTFQILVDSEDIFTPAQLEVFIQASIVSRDNSHPHFSGISPHTRMMIVRDSMLAWQLKKKVQLSIEHDPHALEAAISRLWPDFGNGIFSEWEFLTSPEGRDFVVSYSTSIFKGRTVHQTAHFNYLNGQLLVNGQGMGGLPHEISSSDEIKTLFGSRHLLVFPSSFQGMSHKLAPLVEGHQVFFGLRGGRVIILALSQGDLYEFVPGALFTTPNPDLFDLPASLVDGCVHWMNLSKYRLEIRRTPVLWKTRENDWVIDLRSRMCDRSGRSRLVNPQSSLFGRIASIFRSFIDARFITVFEPLNRPLSVEIKSLDLSFRLSQDGLLECQELGAEIDPDQDAGTLYGFDSKIVLRDVRDRKRRSIIAPIGRLQCRRQGIHVRVVAGNVGEYGRFWIDETLGRLTCAPDPVLLYSKARFHAHTSFCLPDPLTNQTGTEQALDILTSGQCQPTMPLHVGSVQMLEEIRGLCPTREYYPNDKRRLQSVQWRSDLTSTIQHDGFHAVVVDIIIQSNILKRFSTTEAFESRDMHVGHLLSRAIFHRSRYERFPPRVVELLLSYYQSLDEHDSFYHSRDKALGRPESCYVFDIVRALHQTHLGLHLSENFPSLLEQFPLIGGFHDDMQSLPSSIAETMDCDLGERLGSLVQFCRSGEDIFATTFRLALMSFSTKANKSALMALAAFRIVDDLREIEFPTPPSFAEFRHHESPSSKKLRDLMMIDHPAPQGARLSRRRTQVDVTQEQHHNAIYQECDRLAALLTEQWPSEEPSINSFGTRHINVQLALERILPEWQRLFQNISLSKFAEEVELVIMQHRTSVTPLKPGLWTAVDPSRFKSYEQPVILDKYHYRIDILDCGFPMSQLPSEETSTLKPEYGKLSHSQKTSDPPNKNKIFPREIQQLETILDRFAQSSDDLRKGYGQDLMRSLDALKRNCDSLVPQRMLPRLALIDHKIASAKALSKAQMAWVREALSNIHRKSGSQWLERGRLWPCTTAKSLLKLLRTSNKHLYSVDFRCLLVKCAITITEVQRWSRIRTALLKDNIEKVFEELENSGHENWNPVEFPDWILLEIESDILIRREQIEVAREIINPRSKANTVLQLNMGKGKTSCIVPMAAAHLADGESLMRLIVPKALLFQTAQVLQSRLGDLVGREVKHIPFSRRIKTDADTIRTYGALHEEALRIGGIILTVPEHILSFTLSGQQRLSESKLDQAESMIRIQSWLTKTCRDVLDESDFSLAVKTQLIYPGGLQLSIDGHPHRWKCIQAILAMVEAAAAQLQKDFCRAVEVVRMEGRFPLLYILQEEPELALTQQILNIVSEGKMSLLRLKNPPSDETRTLIERVLFAQHLHDATLRQAQKLFRSPSSARDCLLLIRGLIQNKILLLCLRKRWNVNYGLHPERDPLAVPFEAKGVPSPQAEFGHTDVSIIFTCLAFYYSGVNLEQFRQGLQHVLQADDPIAEYDRWTSESKTLPEAYRHWNTINIEDKYQLSEMWKHLRYERYVINHYMNNFVFPVHARQFEKKLQASGWDLPLLLPPSSKIPSNCGRTTGFSGTNDNKMLLPQTISQNDLPTLQQTNAEVISHLLKQRNSRYRLAAARNGKRMSETGLLRELLRLEIRILIDAGAFIMELDNKGLAEAWLKIDTQAKAAIYFGPDNKARVIYRGGRDRPLIATPFAENLEGCLVYLDENHTRGVDLKLWKNATGALTLALNQTKDHTVQAAMRLRQLATTQCVEFFAPPEVHQSILDVCEPSKNEMITSTHVVTWLLEQTCRGNEQLQSLYLAQGADFCQRVNAKWNFKDAIRDVRKRKTFMESTQSAERQTLEQLYGNATNSDNGAVSFAKRHTPHFPQLRNYWNVLAKRRQNSTRFSGAHSSLLAEVEQEREVEFEVEEERQIEKPVHYKPLGYPGLHPAIKKFVQTGTLDGGGMARQHAFEIMTRTEIGQTFKVHPPKSSRLFLSPEFLRTVKLKDTNKSDNFLRSVEFILWCPAEEAGLLIIPEEADQLIFLLRSLKAPPKVHLIVYAAPVTRAMRHFNRFSYYSLPSLPPNYELPKWVDIQLGIVAGRLYFEFSEVQSMTDSLHLNARNTSKNNASNGHLAVPKLEDKFCSNPANFLLEWLSLRRNGQDVLTTPVGYLCQGRNLWSDHPFFRSPGSMPKTKQLTNGVITNGDGGHDESGSEDDE